MNKYEAYRLCIYSFIHHQTEVRVLVV